MWHKCESEMLIEKSNEVVVAERIRRHWASNISGSIGEKILVEKSIANLPRLEFFYTHFKPAKFIYIMRNGYAVAEGIRRRVDPRIWGRTEFGASYPIKLCAEQWAASDRAYKSTKNLIGDVLEISYEELTDETAATLEKVSSFLAVEAFPEAVLNTEWLIHREKSPIQNMNSVAISNLTAAEKIAISDVAGKVLSEYDYAPD